MHTSLEGVITQSLSELGPEESLYDHYHPDFRDTIQQLGFIERPEAAEWHKICAFGEHEDDQYYAYCLLHYTRLHYDDIDDYGVTINNTDLMEQLYGVGLSIADIHYQSGHYISCLMELDRIENAMQLGNHRLLEDVQCMQQHCRQFIATLPQSSVNTDVGYVYFPKYLKQL